MIDYLRRILGLYRRNGHAAHVAVLQERSDAVLARARRAERRAERDRLASAVTRTAYAVRGSRHDH